MGALQITSHIANLAPLIAFAVFLRRWARTYTKACEHMARFRVEDCTCLRQTDRVDVYNNIAKLMRAKGEVDVDAPLSEALNAFNHLVRHELPQALVTSIGPRGLKYEHVALMFFVPLMSFRVDAMASTKAPALLVLDGCGM